MKVNQARRGPQISLLTKFKLNLISGLSEIRGNWSANQRPGHDGNIVECDKKNNQL